MIIRHNQSAFNKKSMIPRLKSVKRKRNHQLLVKFENGENRLFDVSPWLRDRQYQKLNDKEVFKSVRIEDGDICWDYNVRFNSELVYFRSKEYSNRYIMSSMLLTY